VTATVSSEGQSLLVEGEDFALSMSPADAEGNPLTLGSDGTVMLPPEGTVSTSVAGFCAHCDVHVYWHATTSRSASIRSAGPEVLLFQGDANALGLFSGAIAFPSSVSSGSGVMQVVGGVPGGGVLAINVPMIVVEETTPVVEPSIIIDARRGAGREQAAITVRGVATGVSSSQVTISVILGWQSRVAPRTTKVAVSADGSFSWTIRSRASVRVLAEASGLRSNVVRVKAVKRVPLGHHLSIRGERGALDPAIHTRQLMNDTAYFSPQPTQR
jgi:hypothetical protein